MDNVHIYSQSLTQPSQGLLVCFLSSLRFGQRATLFFFFFFQTKKEIVKHCHPLIHRKHNWTICSFLPQPPSLADDLLLCYASDDQTTPSLSCTDCEKCTYHHDLVHPCIFFFLYGEKLLVRREYLKFDWIFSNMEIKHSQCENKCWEILFFCLFGIKVLSINKKRRNLKLVGVVVFCVCCPQVPCCFCHVLFVLVTLRCTEQELRRSVLLGPVDWGGDEGCGGLSSRLCPFHRVVCSLFFIFS